MPISSPVMQEQCIFANQQRYCTQPLCQHAALPCNISVVTSSSLYSHHSSTVMPSAMSQIPAVHCCQNTQSELTLCTLLTELPSKFLCGTAQTHRSLLLHAHSNTNAAASKLCLVCAGQSSALRALDCSQLSSKAHTCMHSPQCMSQNSHVNKFDTKHRCMFLSPNMPYT